MKKKLAALILAGMMGVLAACSTSGNTAGANEQSQSTAAQSQAETEAGTEAQEETQEQSQHYPLNISTFNYAKEPVEVTFLKAPEKVITAWQNSVETMLSLGLEDRIVSIIGVKEEDITPSLRDAYQKIQDKEFNDFSDSNAAMSKETAIMLEPDFILAWKSTFSDKTLGDVDYWHEHGVNTYMALNSNDISEYRTVDNEYQDILHIGKIFDVEDKAQAIVDEMKAAVDKVTSATEGRPKKKALIVEFMGDSINVYNSTTLAGDMVTKMGATLMESENKISAEDLIALDPEVIFVIHMEGYGEGAGSEAMKNITGNPAYNSLLAVENNQIFPLNLSDVYTSGIRTIDGLNAIGIALYPELYQE